MLSLGMGSLEVLQRGLITKKVSGLNLPKITGGFCSEE